MKQFSSILFIGVLFSQLACMRIANRVAYGPSGKPKVESTSKNSPANSTIKPEQASNAKTSEWVYIAKREPENLRDTITFLRNQIETYKFDIVILNKQLQRAELKSETDLKSYQNALAIKENEVKLTRIQHLQDNRKIDSLKYVAEEIQEKYIRYEAGVQKTLQSPAYHRNAVIIGNNSILTTEYREPIGKPKATTRRSGSKHSTYTPKSEQYYIRGPRGGCYYYTASGRKEYVDRSLCN